ncbi:MAG: LLM class flavin-dependent oxidoreductase [Candidatus Binatus sp.]|uniref:LLM class flavin-dependent oxidoreductase n=1 Tax=Candidatus Binatus sp. TaxID=2811406 RepID=UPI00271E9E4E|nr:LLM class flavin-dependent oxidoreductase [Candidatus Binatus sp.]MDO8433367.1 LLM class flavin-dependent oxidoreductase [Candidatus Binatus sp.]
MRRASFPDGVFAQLSAGGVLRRDQPQRTSRIRLGHGVVLLPHRYNHPARVAERAAVLDILSNGRVELGTGRSITEQELGGFMIDPDETIEQWEEAVRAIPQMWMKDKVSFDGKHLKMPERSVLPKPIQKPHPPLWHAATQPSSFERAGKLGVGLLSFGFLAPGMLEAQLKIYRDAAETCTNPAGAFVNNQVASSAMACCAETRAKAYEVAEPNMRFFWELGQQLYIPKSAKTYQYYANISDALISSRGQKKDDSKPLTVAPIAPSAFNIDAAAQSGAVICGNPDDCIKAVQKYPEAGIDELMLLVQVGRMPHAAIMDTIKLIGRHVIPYFKNVEPEGAARPPVSAAAG